MGDLTYSSPKGTVVLAPGNQKANGRRDTSNSGARHAPPIFDRQDPSFIEAVVPAQASRSEMPKS